MAEIARAGVLHARRDTVCRTRVAGRGARLRHETGIRPRRSSPRSIVCWPDTSTSAIRSTAGCCTSCSARAARMSINGPDVGNVIDLLSNRELEVFQLVARGHGTRDIATEMHVSVKTIETYRAHIKEKLRLRTAPELIRFAVNWAGQQNCRGGWDSRPLLCHPERSVQRTFRSAAATAAFNSARRSDRAFVRRRKVLRLRDTPLRMSLTHKRKTL